MALVATLAGGLWYLLFFVIALSVIVAIHEYGHYIVGRWCGIRAEVFSIGFGPVLLSRTDRRGTRWQIAAIPFGGYVRFLGDADAASLRSDPAAADLAPAMRRQTMEGAPLWARTATVIAGPAANFVLAFAVMLALLLSTGVMTDRPTVSRLAALPVAQSLQPGDVITAVDGMPTPDAEGFAAALAALPRVPQVTFTVLRDGHELTLAAPHPQPALVASVQPKSAAVAAGLRAGDVITRAGGRDITTFSDLQEVVLGSNGAPIALTVWRGGESFGLTLTPRPRDIPDEEAGGFENRWMIGVASGLAFDLATRAPTPLEAVALPAAQVWSMVSMTFSGLYHMVAGQISTCSMSGVIGIAETMGDAASAGTLSFLSMLAVLSLGIGILNLLPVPVLDGGHLAFFAYEAVAGRPPPEAALRILMAIGLAILIALMAFTLMQDVTCV